MKPGCSQFKCVGECQWGGGGPCSFTRREGMSQGCVTSRDGTGTLLPPPRHPQPGPRVLTGSGSHMIRESRLQLYLSHHIRRGVLDGAVQWGHTVRVFLPRCLGQVSSSILVKRESRLRAFRRWGLICSLEEKIRTWVGLEMATHSSILAWKIPCTEESGRLQSMGSQESDMTE